jgi:hypothetical protein
MSESRRRRGPKRLEDSTPVVRRMLEVSGWANETEMAQAIGAASSTMSRRLRKGQDPPPLWIKYVAARFGAREEYLRTGQGPRYERVRPAESYGRGADLLLDAYHRLTPDQRRLLWRVAGLIPAFDSDLRYWCELMEGRLGWHQGVAHPEADPEGLQDPGDPCQAE